MNLGGSGTAQRLRLPMVVQAADPGTPTSGTVILYVKAGGLFQITPAGRVEAMVTPAGRAAGRLWAEQNLR